MIILAIDPGNTKSGFVFYETKTDKIIAYGKKENNLVKNIIEKNRQKIDLLVIEMLSSYGVVGASVFETAIWIGRFVEFWKLPYCLIKRSVVRGFWTPDDGYVEKLIKDDIIKKWPKTTDKKIKIMLDLKYKIKIEGKAEYTNDIYQAIALAGCFAGRLNGGKISDKDFTDY